MRPAPALPTEDTCVHQDALISAVRTLDLGTLHTLLDQHPEAMRPLGNRTPLGTLFLDYPHQIGRARPPRWHDCLKLLMAHGGDPTVSHSHGGSVVHHLLKAAGGPYACDQALGELADLYRFGADPNAPIATPNSRSSTALGAIFSTLMWQGSVDYPVARAARVLIAAGARPTKGEPFPQIKAGLVNLSSGGRHPTTVEDALVAVAQHPGQRMEVAQLDEHACMDRLSVFVRGRWPRVMALFLADLEDLGTSEGILAAARSSLFPRSTPEDEAHRVFMNQCFLEHRTPRATVAAREANRLRM